jgi:hypothetical protein
MNTGSMAQSRPMFTLQQNSNFNMHFLPNIGTLHIDATMKWGLLWQELGTNLYLNLILTLSIIVHNKVRSQNNQWSRCPKFEFLCTKADLFHVGIVQKVPKVKKSARLIESRESSRWLTPLLLGLWKQNHTRSMLILPIYMEIMMCNK